MVKKRSAFSLPVLQNQMYDMQWWFLHTFPPVVVSHAFVGLLQGEMTVVRPSPVEGADGLQPPVLVQNLPVVDKTPFQFLAVEQSIDHLEVWRRACGMPTPFRVPHWLHPSGSVRVSVRPGFGRTERVCVSILRVGVGAVAGHFNRLCAQSILLSLVWEAKQYLCLTLTLSLVRGPSAPARHSGELAAKLYPPSWNKVHVDAVTGDNRPPT